MSLGVAPTQHTHPLLIFEVHRPLDSKFWMILSVDSPFLGGQDRHELQGDMTSM